MPNDLHDLFHTLLTKDERDELARKLDARANTFLSKEGCTLDAEGFVDDLIYIVGNLGARSVFDPAGYDEQSER